jgi:hypothetical protein
MREVDARNKPAQDASESKAAGFIHPLFRPDNHVVAVDRLGPAGQKSFGGVSIPSTSVRRIGREAGVASVAYKERRRCA